VEDSTGAVGFGKVTVVCNRATGVLEERADGRHGDFQKPFSTFTSTTNVSNNYIRRVSGWVVPQKSGAYTFWIASDDDACFT
jgi:hypothetical protein